jgi:hypothetical protein
VKLSLSDLVSKKGKEALTESYCRAWLRREERRKRPTLPPRTPEALHEESAPDRGELLEPGTPEAIAAWNKAAGVASALDHSDPDVWQQLRAEKGIAR